MKCLHWFQCVVIVLVFYLESFKCNNSTTTVNNTAETEIRKEVVRKSKHVFGWYKNSFFENTMIAFRPKTVGPYSINARPYQFPFMVALGFYHPIYNHYKFSCGGSLITPTFVLTAAHCTNNPDKYDLKIVRSSFFNVPDSTTSIDPVHDIEVERIIPHEKHSNVKKLNDIALVELKKKATEHLLQTACLYIRSYDPPKLEVAGWGSLSLGGKRSPYLRTAPVKLVPNAECEKKHSRANPIAIKINASHICAGDEKRNTCEGDSGGPLLYKEKDVSYLVGITSHGQCGTKVPGVYTRVSSFLGWMEEKISDFNLKTCITAENNDYCENSIDSCLF